MPAWLGKTQPVTILGLGRLEPWPEVEFEICGAASCPGSPGLATGLEHR